MFPGERVRGSLRCGLRFGPRLASLPPPPSRPRPARFPRAGGGSPRHPSPPPGATQSFPQLGRVPRRCRGSSFSPPLPPPAPSPVRQGEKFHLLQQKREKTSPSSPSPGPGGTAERSSRRRRCHHRGEAPPPAARKSSRRAGGGGEGGKPAAASAAAPAPAMLRARLAVAAATTPGQSRPVPLPAPPAPPHTVPVSLSGAGRAAPALSERAAPPAAGRGGRGKAGRVCQAPPPRPPPPPPRPGASRFAPALPAQLCGTRDAPCSSGGSRWYRGRSGRRVGGGVTASSPGGLLVRPAPPLPPAAGRGRGRPAGLGTGAPLPPPPLRLPPLPLPAAGPGRPLPRGWGAASSAGTGGGPAAALSAGRGYSQELGGPAGAAPGTVPPQRGRLAAGLEPRSAAAGVQSVPRGFANNKLSGVVLSSLSLPLSEPRAVSQRVPGSEGRAGAPLPQHLPTGLVPLEAVPEPAGEGRIRRSGTIWEQSEPCAELTEEYQIRP